MYIIHLGIKAQATHGCWSKGELNLLSALGSTDTMNDRSPRLCLMMTLKVCVLLGLGTLFYQLGSFH